jgi:sec-independent protein translocase protein TatA
MFGLGTTELILILAIVVIIFGVGKLPELGSGMGKAIKNFKKATEEIDVTPEKEKQEFKSTATTNESK